SNPELVSYTDDNRQQRWEAVRQAAEAVMNLGYKLYDVDADRVTNFANIFLKNSDEQIFITKYDKINFPEYWGTDWVMIYEPGTFGGYSLNQVTGNLANAFENADGTDFDFAVQSDAPYLNRDPRFYATILSEGTEWKYPDWNYWAMMPYTVHCGRWVNADGATVSIGGDYYSGGANTGYYIRKFIDSDVFQYYYGDRQHHPYIQIRYAEVLLNYAEACIALGREDDARSAINQLRKRAGMPDITDTGEALVGRYRNERRVELAWEQHRFFDVRRWMIASEAYVPAKGVDIIYPVEGSTDNPVYKETVVEQRAWNVSHYLVPIGRNEMQKNQALIQNPGYN
ncbi:MAG: RagB/SusD family nutrient uptake outer membrane protein, partial [Tannerella sp.]|nr:RagB/SusD family nutrient uptake outer membrane protein [Tannerella sp.]